MKPITRKILLLVAESLFFCLSGVTLFQVLWLFIQDVNSTDSSIMPLLPYYLSCLLPFYITIIIHHLRHAPNEVFKKRWMKWNSVILLVFSLFVLVLDVLYVGKKFYPGLNAHRGGPLFPLLSILFCLLCCGIAVALFAFQTKKLFHYDETDALPKRKLGPLCYFGMALLSPFACGFLGDFILFPVMMDYTLANFWFTLPVYLLMLFPSLCMLARDIAYTFVESSKRGLIALKGYTLETAVGVALVIWMCIGLVVNPNFIIDSMTAHFPIDFMASKLIGPYALFFLGLLTPVAPFMCYLFLGKKQ